MHIRCRHLQPELLARRAAPRVLPRRRPSAQPHPRQPQPLATAKGRGPAAGVERELGDRAATAPGLRDYPLDYLEAGDPLDKFREQFPTVTREMAIEALETAKESLLAEIE
ncbi:MAG: hypothetical protein DMG22_09540 [Acidobacteria bacterium]|nr:MAG: hypothetical protein DMG22_09540 [Acidobacteriota bacterium]